jgi:hypothetical protein
VGLALPKVERILVVDGSSYAVECAVEEDGSSPAGAFLQALASGTWEETIDEDAPDEQVADYDAFLEFCRRLAESGLPPGGGQYNYLRNGIWEFKRATKRLTWFDTPGDGTFAPKHRITDSRQSRYPSTPEWSFPDFDEYIRLGHAFPKVSQKTADIDLDEAERVRREDLEHDSQ